MPESDGRSLWLGLSAAGDLSGCFLWGDTASVALSDLAGGSSLGGQREALRGRSVLLATRSQLTAALALIELDGLARRMVLCPADLPAEHVRAISATAEIDAVVSDRLAVEFEAAVDGPFVICEPRVAPMAIERDDCQPTEWILLTSGTTGVPKLVVHSLAGLAGPTRAGAALGRSSVWSTFYDIRRYGGLQIFFRALLGGGSLVLSSATESTGDFLQRAGARAVTHISGTPSHWRRALMSPMAHRMAPKYVRLSGEIADQAILDRLKAFYAEASVAHAFASTEAGVGFEVGDGLAGFPADYVGRPGEVAIAVVDSSLRLRSGRTATRYLGSTAPPLADGNGFVDTGDMVERRGERYYFIGRRGGIINVGGQKVHPEEVEAVINGHPQVQMSLAKARRNPITGAVVTADVVLKAGVASLEAIKGEILDACHGALPPHKVPVSIRFVSSLDVTSSGKLNRGDA